MTIRYQNTRFLHAVGLLAAGIAVQVGLSACASPHRRHPQTNVAPVPPALARVEPFTETIQGVEVSDPYRWMENANDPELVTWVDAQRRYAETMLSFSPGWKALRDRMAATFSALPTLGTVTPFRGGALVLRWLEDGLSIHLLLDGSGAERTLFTARQLGEMGRPARIRALSPSFDGRYVAVSTTGGGDGSVSVSVVEIATGKVLPDFVPDLLTTLSGSRYHVTWLPDSSGFVYPRLAPGYASAPATERLARGRQFLHRLGRPMTDDVPLFGYEVDPGIELAVDDLPSSILAAAESPWIVGTLFRAAENRSEVWAARWKPGFDGVGGWRLVASSGYGTLRLRGDELYALTALGADRRRIVAADLAAPAIEFREVVPERAGLLNDYVLTPEALYFTELRAARMSLVRWRARGSERVAEPIDVPIEGGLRFAAHDSSRAEPWLEASSWIDPGGWFQVPREGKVAERVAIDPGGDPEAASAVAATSEDSDLVVEARLVEVEGVRVPVSIVRPRHLPEGGAPVLLEAYGGYGQVRIPEFDPFAAIWARQGGVWVYAHVRGGGELGETWHTSATRDGKIKSTTDVIGVARWLVAQGVTRRGRIALVGTSSGAQLPGLALAIAPELFGAVVFNVGAPDEIRGAELDPTAARNLAELGDMTSRHGVELLRDLSPYHRVPERARFPAIIVKTARDDYNFGGAAADLKYVARLQAANHDGGPILWLDLPGGHSDVFSDDPESSARTMAFLLWQTGQPGFVP